MRSNLLERSTCEKFTRVIR